MYTKEVEIPAVGEQATVPDVKGGAVQVVRLDFLGAEDPLGNPVIKSLKAPRRSWSTEAVQVDPIPYAFDGLVVQNPTSSAAAGTTMILEVYEQGDKIRDLKPRKQVVEPPRPSLESVSIDRSGKETSSDATVGYSPPIGPDVNTIPIIEGAQRATRLVGGVVEVVPFAVGSGFEVDVWLQQGSPPAGVWIERVVCPIEGREVVALPPALVKKGDDLSVRIDGRGDGSDTFNAKVEGTYQYETSERVPPR